MLYHLISGLLVLAAAMASDAADHQAPFRVTTKRADDRVHVNADADKVVVSIESPSGISGTVIERTGEKWPNVVVLHLHLKGLENFRACHDQLQLEAAVSSHDGTLRLWKDGLEDQPLDPLSPYWMKIRRLGNDGQPGRTIPLNDGYFEVPLPKAFFEGHPKSISLSWIDFYRN